LQKKKKNVQSEKIYATHLEQQPPKKLLRKKYAILVLFYSVCFLDFFQVYNQLFIAENFF